MTSTQHDRYPVERLLGEGGMGLVYLVRDPLRGGARLALKQIRAERLTPSVRAAMSREFGLLTRLRHPNLVEVYDFSLEPDCWFTMEYVEGQDLRQARLDGDELIEAVVQVCRALEYIHSRGLIHLDVKPTNILINRTPQLTVKLMDFGVASEGTSGAASGYTLGYVAPEILEARGFDGRADLYSLGMCLIALAEPAQDATSDITLQVRPLDGAGRGAQPAPELGHLPEALRPIVQRLTRLDPSERYGSAAQVIEALAAATGRAFTLETAATRAGRLHSARLCGRDAELAVLQARYAAARGGAGRHLMVTGAAGIGKTRLLKELRVSAQLDGALVVAVTGASEAPSHRVVASLAAQLAPLVGRFRSLAAHHAAALARLAHSVEAAVAPAAEEELGSQAARSRITEAVLALVAAAARSRTVVITVDDADRVDEASQQILLALRNRLDSGELGGALLLLAAREPGRFAGGDHLRLQPLGDAAVRALVDDTLGPGAAPPALHRRIAAAAAGNGLFVTELLELAAERGILVQSAGDATRGWSCDERALAAAVFPTGAAQAVGERLALLEPPLRRSMWLAAMLGPSFDADVVAEASPDADTRALVDELVGRLFVEAEGRSFRFSHAEVRAAALADARAGGDWPRLHRRLAAALERAGGHPADVARLYLESDAHGQALPHLEQAAARAAAVHDHASAVGHLDAALALAPGAAGLHLRRLAAIRAGGLGSADPRAAEALVAAAEPAAAVEAHLELARIAAARGRFAEAIAHAGEVDRHAGRLVDRTAAARARAEAHRTAGLARMSLGQLPAARSELDAAVAAYARLADDVGHAGALNDRGFIHGYAGDFAAALADHESALAVLRRLAPGAAQGALAATHNNLSFTAWNLGRYDAARSHLGEALVLRRRLGDLGGEGVTRNNIGNVLRHTGDLEAAAAEYLAAATLCRRSGNVLYEAIAGNNLGQIEEERGRLERAAAWYRAALELVVGIGDRIREGDNLGNLGACLLRAGRPDEARELLRRAVALRRAIGDRAYVVLDLSYLAVSEQALGEGAAARRAIEEALAVLDAGQEGTEQVQAVFLNGYKVYRALGDGGRARALLTRALGLLASRLGSLPGPGARAAFLDRVQVNREIVAAANAEGLASVG